MVKNSQGAGKKEDKGAGKAGGEKNYRTISLFAQEPPLLIPTAFGKKNLSAIE
ncbi:hypothetical protein NIES4072_59530 [Nostoc commune NIES-4072]|uniref:Uncharacterized protein n=1 Tax=Nostoc commune NIES-4072 TaxID=2005467 RepID=A0A2R5FVC5_NOSCO|nr:hypothetical protein [Nostoc commune]BBD66771.1 hypothetical protein NIES4070_31400 [Nostoc commune HK-02]GBG22245.1 hypothetical protein NIES4072_59530 [Nostoc commune NIES-4072]